jgi:glycosyltransferase involved in cell wall biosynthesis
MRVLLVHNRYRLEGGEERAVADIAALLERRGHEVALLERSSADVPSLRAARALIAGGVDPEAVAAAVRELGAEVAHFHNLHPLFGWRALAAAREAGARTVLHLHNFRLFCAIGIAYRDGAPCFRCRGRNTLPGVVLRCRGSVGEAAVYGAGLRRQQPHLFTEADRFITVSDATARRLEALGLPAGRTAVLPNFVPANEFALHSHAGAGEHALVSGRLVEEKGFDTAIAAADQAGVPIVVAGDGPDLERLRTLAAGTNTTFAGRLDAAALADVRSRAAVTLVPSRWEEPCPYSVLDSLAAGVPALVSDIGGLPALVADGEPAIAPADTQAWANALATLWTDIPTRQRRGEEALTQAREQFSEDRYYNALISIYESLLAT